jgi:hypothetical protein
MATTPKVLLKRSSVIGRAPQAGDLEYGEIALNFADGKIYYKDNNDNIKSFIDSAIINDLIERISLDSADVLPIIRSISLDSAEAIALIQAHALDSSEALALISSYSLDSSEIAPIVDSNYVQLRQSYDALTLGGNNPNYYNNYLNLYNEPNVLDSADIAAITLDSGEITDLIDSAHVQLHQSYNALTLNGDSANVFLNYENLANKPTILDYIDVQNAAQDLVDAPYVQARQDYAYASLTGKPDIPQIVRDNSLDSAEAQGIIDSNLQTLNQNIIPETDVAVDLGSPSKRFRDLYLGPNSIYIGSLTLSDSNGVFVIKDALGNQADLSIDSQVFFLIDSAYVNRLVDSGQIITIISDNAVDSSEVQGIIDTNFPTKTTTDIGEGTNLYYTTARADSDAKNAISGVFAGGDGAFSYDPVTGVITATGPSAAEVRAHFSAGGDLTYNSATGEFTFDVEQVYTKANFDSDLGDANTGQLPEGTNLYYTTTRHNVDTVNQVNATYVQSRQSYDYNLLINRPTNVSTWANDANYLDSSTVTGVIDASYVQTNQTPQDFAYASLTGAPTNVSQFANDANYLDSTTSQAVINTNFATKTTDDLTEGSTNKYYVKSRVDSDIAASLNDSGNTVTITINNTIEDKVDSAYVLNRVAEAPFLDSVDAINLIDSAYVQLRQDYAYASLTGAPTNVSQFTNDAEYIATGDSAILQEIDVTGNVVIGGNLQVQGTTFTANTASFSVDENLFYLNDAESAGSPTQYVDIGFSGNVNETGTYTHAGFFRDATDGTWQVFNSYTPEPDTTELNTGHASYTLAPFKASTLTGVYQGFDSDFGTKTTSNLTEGSNLYYTDARVTAHVDAAYVQALQTPQDFAYASLTGAPTNVSAFANDAGYLTDALDSAEAIALIDSAYVQARQSGVDSGAIIQLIDSAYVQARQSGVDSDAIIQLIDSAYVNARVAAGTDSATVSGIILDDVDSNYVQARQINVTAVELTTTNYEYTASASQSFFDGVDDNGLTLSYYIGKVHVYLNGLLLAQSDYTAANGESITLNVAADSGDVLIITKFDGNDTGAQAIEQRHYVYTATASQTVFTGADDNSATLSYTQGRVNVYMNGLLLLNTVDYTQNVGGDTITLTSGALAGSILDIQTLSGNTGTYAPLVNKLYEFTATAGQTEFTGLDDYSQDLQFSGDKITVYLDGVLLAAAAYSTTNGDKVTLTTGASAGNLITVAKLTGNNVGIDSASVIGIIDSAYVAAISPPIDLTSVDGHIIPSANATYDLGDSNNFWRDLYLSGNTLVLGNLKIEEHTGRFRFTNRHSGDEVKLAANNIGSNLIDSSVIFSLIDSAYIGDRSLDAAATILLIDSSYVQLRQTPQDFAFSSLTGTPTTIAGYGITDAFDGQYSSLTGAPTNVSQFANDAGYTVYDSTNTLGLIDSAYINARVSATDSAAVISIVQSTVDSAYVNAFTLEATTLGGHDSSYYLNYNNLANTPNIISQIQTTVNQSFVNALNVDADTLDGNNGAFYLDYTNFTSTPSILNATQIRALFDTEIETQAATKLDHLSYTHDSDVSLFTVLVDAKTDDHRYKGQGSSSSYTINGDEAPFLVLQPGQTYYFDQSDGSNNGHPLQFYYDAAKNTQYTTGVTVNGTAGNAGAHVLLEVTDTTPNVLHYQCGAHAYMGNAISAQSRNLTGFTTDNLTEGTSNLYYTDAKVDSRINTVVNAAFINSKVTHLDSSSADVLFTTEAEVNTLISAIETGVDSATVFTLIDSAYIIARAPGGGGGSGNAFTTIAVAGQSNVEADTTTDTLTLVAGSNITITTDAGTDTITINSTASGGGGVAGVADGLTVDKYQYVATAGQTVFGDSDVNGSLLSYDIVGNEINAYLNGILLIDSDDFTMTDSSHITLTLAADSGDRITLIRYTPPEEGVDSAAVTAIVLGAVDSDYIQARQTVFARGTLEINKYSYTATAAQTVFTGVDNFGNTLSIQVDNIEVYLNGILLVQGDDFTATTTAITLTTGADAGYNIQVIETVGRVSNDVKAIGQTAYEYTAAVGQTVFTGVDNNSTTLALNLSGTVDVHLNGLLLSNGNDYNYSASTVTLLDAADSGDFLSITNKFGNLISPTVKIFEYLADSGQSIISGGGLTYAAGALQVHLNGVMLSPNVDYVANDGTTISLTNPLDSGDDIFISAFSNPGLALTTFTFIANAAQTVFTGLDRDSASFIYNTTDNQVFINGILIDNVNDYTATSSTILTLTQGTNAGDEVKIMSYDQTSATIIKNDLRDWKETPVTPYQAVAGDRLFLDVSSSPKTVTLPASAIMGDEIRIIDATGNASTNNITVARNGHNILGNASDLTINIDRSGIGLVYYNATQGWILIEN